MAEKIYTIPINDAFDLYDGCPICRLYAGLEQNSLEYVMGAAMMEPDVRTVTNHLGFCRKHFDRMLELKSKLSLALMLESHLNEVKSNIFPSKKDIKLSKMSKLRKNTSDDTFHRIHQQSCSCYVCSRVESFEKKYLENIIYLWKHETTFCDKFKKQKYFCLPHSGKLLEYGQALLSEETYMQFAAVIFEIESAHLEQLSSQVSAFCKSFDHRYASLPLGEERKSIQNSIDFLTGK